MAKNTTENCKILETYIENSYLSKGYTIIENRDFAKLTVTEQSNKKFLVKNYPYSSICSHNSRLEFFDFYKKTAIECKFQDVSGTAREKLPYSGINLLEQPFNSYIVYEGKYFIPNLIKKCKDVVKSLALTYNISQTKVQYLSLSEFEKTILKCL